MKIPVKAGAGSDRARVRVPGAAWLALAALAIAGIAGLASSFRRAAPSRPAAAPAAARIAPAIPLAFEANVGQADPRVRFVAHGPGYGLFLTDDQIVLAMGASKPHRDAIEPAALMHPAPAAKPAQLRLRFLGANRAAHSTGLDPLAARINYFIGNDPARWQTGVPAYSRVRYSGLYPGIDLVYYGNRSSLEFDLIVSPGGHPEAVRLALEGAPARIDTNGDLVLGDSASAIVMRKPRIYQQEGGARLPIDGAYRVVSSPDRRTQTIALALGPYDRGRALIIDPQLVYSSYLTSANDSLAAAVAAGAGGLVYVAGLTYSPHFPVTANALQKAGTAQDQTGNAFVSVVNPAAPPASQLVYSSYLGGHHEGVGEPNTPGGDFAAALAVDRFGMIYLTGGTQSVDFPTTASAFQNRNKELQGSGSDVAFISVINPRAFGVTGLIYSTFLGGSGSFAGGFVFGDQGKAIQVDSRGLVYVTGSTGSSDFPVTREALQATANGPANAFVSVINPHAFGSASLAYSTYLGGSDFVTISGFPVGEQPSGIGSAPGGNICVAGSTASTDFPVTEGAFQASNNSSFAGGTQAFLTVLNLNRKGAAQLAYSSYLGGDSYDAATSLAVDSRGRAYLAGTTQSDNFPTTLNAYHLSPNAVRPEPFSYITDGFLSVFNPAASGSSSMLYSTLLAGVTLKGGATPMGVALDSGGLAYLGLQVSSDFPTTADALQAQLLTYGSAVSVIDPAAAGDASLRYSSFFGGTDNGGANITALAVGSRGKVDLAGFTAADDFPLTANAMNTNPSFLGPFLSLLDLPVAAAPPPPKPVAAALQLSSANLQFPPTIGSVSGTPSQPMSIGVTNPKPNGPGSLPVTVEGLATGGDFHIDPSSTTCVSGRAIASGGSCTVGVIFEPTGAGTRNGLLVVTDNGKGSPHQVALSGQSAPTALQVTTAQAGGGLSLSTSDPQGSVGLQNFGLEPITISNVSIDNSQFTATFAQPCPTVAPLGGSCEIDVTYTPTTSAPQTATLTITDDAANSPQTVTITGTSD